MIDSNKFILKCQDLKISGNVSITYVPVLEKSALSVAVHFDNRHIVISDWDNDFMQEWLECFYRAERIL